MDKHEIISDLMDRHGTDVLHLAYSYVRNHQTAEDLAQEIFIKCYEKLDTFQGNSSIDTWLYRVAVNHCKDYVTSWHYRKMHASDVISSYFTGGSSSAEQDLIEQEEKTELLNEIFQLPLKYREIIFLYYYQQCTQKEIGDICGLNLNTVKSRMTRGKEILKKSLTKRGEWNGERTGRSKRSKA